MARNSNLFRAYILRIADVATGGSSRAISVHRATVALLLNVILATPLINAAGAQESEAASAQKLSLGRIFHVEVNGTPAGTNPTRRLGKAFAVAPNLFITARHVVGTHADWKTVNPPDELRRVVRLLDRTISLTRVKEFDPVDFTQATNDVFVVPPLSDEFDAVVVSAPDLKVEDPFRLSFCDIAEGKRYRALLTESDPTRFDSLGKPVAVDIVARGYRPDDFGTLYVFEPDRSQTFSKEPHGNGGAPIVDEAGDVVAMVSAVFTQGSTLILATPITPQIPGASSFLARIPAADGQDAVQCSLGQTVRKIYDRVASQYYWSAEVSRAADGTIDKIFVTYDDPTGETAMPSVKILPTFLGITKNFQDKIETIPDIRPYEEQYITSTPADGGRTYEFTGLGQIGNSNYQADANNNTRKCTENKCGIRQLRIDIFPQINANLSHELVDEGQFLRRPIARSFPWTARQ